MIAKPLTERIELQSLSVTNNPSGETLEIYTTFKTVYASLTKQSGSVRFNDGPDFYDNPSFYLRYIPNLPKKGLKIKYQDRLYKVNNISIVPRNEATIIDCTVTI